VKSFYLVVLRQAIEASADDMVTTPIQSGILASLMVLARSDVRQQDHDGETLEKQRQITYNGRI